MRNAQSRGRQIKQETSARRVYAVAVDAHGDCFDLRFSFLLTLLLFDKTYLTQV